VLVLLSGLGPVLAWRRATPTNLRRALLIPVSVAGATLVVLLAFGLARKPLALALFCFAAFVFAAVTQEFWRGVRVRRAMSHDSVPRALVSLVGRNRRRYGGYIVHAGIAVLFVGIAASSTFRHIDDVRLSPGQKARVGGYDITYVRPTGRLDTTSSGSLEKIDLGAELRARRGGETRTLRPSRSFFPSNSAAHGALSRYFEGEATSEVGLHEGLRRDLWTVVSPNLSTLQPIIIRGDKVFQEARSLPRAERAAALGEGLRRLVERYRAEPLPVTFRVLVSPLVTWIWLGALIVFSGGLIALWPLPVAAARRAAADFGARLWNAAWREG
jgi:cytochrome c-type biogenesis protein CcmF